MFSEKTDSPSNINWPKNGPVPGFALLLPTRGEALHWPVPWATMAACRTCPLHQPVWMDPDVSNSSLQPILALLGWPAAGNPTQYMTEKAFAHHELDWRYLTLEVAPDDLGDAVRGLRALGFCGGNCAQPHKRSILPHLDRTTQTAGLVGVVNLIVRDEDELIGENTEGKALVESLARQTNPTEKRIVLLGAGRMARAVAVELALAGAAEITVVNRTEDHAAELAELIGGNLDTPCSAVVWDGEYSVPPETDVLIHATSIVQDDPRRTASLEPDSLSPQMTVVDATIDPPGTWLLDEARRRGCTTIDGVEVFVRQAAINFQRWTGVDPEQTVLREAVEEFLEL